MSADSDFEWEKGGIRAKHEFLDEMWITRNFGVL